MSDSDLTPFENTVSEIFRRMGMPEPAIMDRIFNDWDQVAGDPWAGRSQPVDVRGSTLVVEASTPSLVAFLRYAVSDLVETLENLIGQGKITDVEVRPPRRF